MIKITAFFTCFLLLTKIASAQKDSLAFDDKGKYIYYKVASCGTNSPAMVYKKALAFINAADNKVLKLTSQDDKNTALTGTGLFLVYKASFTKHPEGQITYHFTIEVKGEKYRYWLTDFTYTPYYRDRYNSYVPKTGIEVPLEKKSPLLSDKDKSQYLDDCAVFARQFGEKLKSYLTKQAAPAAKKDTSRKVIHIDKW